MEPLRTFIVQSQQRAERTQFDADPYRPWDRPGAHSLPPAPDVPKQARSKGSAHDIRQALADGKPVGAVAKALGVTRQQVYTTRYKMKTGRAVAAAAVEVEHATPAQPRQRPVMVALPGPAGACTAIAVAAVFAFEVRVQPMPITRSVTVSAERRSGTHVLDWERRMAAYTFDGPARPKCKPKKGHKRVCGLTRGQMRDELRGHARALPLAINCAAPPARSPSPFD